MALASTLLKDKIIDGITNMPDVGIWASVAFMMLTPEGKAFINKVNSPEDMQPLFEELFSGYMERTFLLGKLMCSPAKQEWLTNAVKEIKNKLNRKNSPGEVIL